MPNPYRRLARGEQRPGTCLRCKRDADLIDLGADEIPQYGVVYLCGVCTGELLDALGMIPKSDIDVIVKPLNAQILSLQNELGHVRDAAIPTYDKELRNALDAHHRAGSDLARIADRLAPARAVDDQARTGLRGSDGRDIDLSIVRRERSGSQLHVRDDDGSVEVPWRDGGPAERVDVWDALSAPVPDEADR